MKFRIFWGDGGKRSFGEEIVFAGKAQCLLVVSLAADTLRKYLGCESE